MHRLTLRSLDSFNRREPRRYTVGMVIHFDPFGFDGDDIPSMVRVGRRSQFFLTDRMRPVIGPFIAEAQHIQGSTLFGDGSQTRCVV